MYIATVPNRKSPPAILLRESYREHNKVSTRTLLNLSAWPEERIEAFRRLLRGEYDSHPDGFEIENGKVVGVLFVLRELLRRLKIEEVLGKSKQAKLCAFMICARVAAQGSRLSAVRWARNHAVTELLNVQEFTEDDLYAALDWLAQEQENIEDALYKEYFKHDKPPVLVLYDVTSSYFEGEDNQLAEYGYNRDGKRGKKQIVIGLLAAPDGEPLAVRVFRGNTGDPATVQEQIELLKERFKIQEVVFVGDRGMVKAKSKETLVQHGFKYITALTDPQILKLLREDKLQIGLFDEEVHEVVIDTTRYVLRRNNQVKEKEEKRRHDKIAKLEKLIEERNKYVETHTRASPTKGLSKLQAWATRHKISSFATLSLDGKTIKLAVDKDAFATNALLDGCYVIESNVAIAAMNSKEVHQSYLSLQKVERDFRTMKTGLLEVRPIFLRKDSRTRAHVFIAMLALKVARHFHSSLRDMQAEYPNFSVTDALDALGRLTFLNFTSQNTVTTRLPKTDSIQPQILQSLNIIFPQNHL